MTAIAHPELEGLERYKFGWADSDVAGESARRACPRRSSGTSRR
jgi:Fe-S cluster assembly protein SufB